MAQEAKARLHRWESMPKERLSEKLDRRIITGEETGAEKWNQRDPDLHGLGPASCLSVTARLSFL